MDEPVNVSVENQIGWLQLNRPKALNALDSTSLIIIDDQLKQWAVDDQIKAVVISGAGERAFCAGGDIRELYHTADTEGVMRSDFFKREYAMNAHIYHFPKPYIALIHGITMGGGVGVSLLGSIRVAADNLVLAMPEASIGFFPDVGASYLLSHLPVPGVGLYMGLCSGRLSATLAQHCGLVDYVVDLAALEQIKQLLKTVNFKDASEQEIKKLIAPFSSKQTLSQAEQELLLVCALFEQNTVAEIIHALEHSPLNGTKDVLATLTAQSPTSVCLIFELLQRAKTKNIDDCLLTEGRLAEKLVKSTEMREGIRAAVIDKDRNPQWQPTSIADVDLKRIVDFFDN